MHGKTLTKHKFQKSMIRLQYELPVNPTKEDMANLQRKELDLTIDYRLGQNYPSDKRDQLWKISKDVERRRGRLVVYWMLYRVFQFFLFKWVFDKKAMSLIDFLYKSFNEVLTDEEMTIYFGDDFDGA